MAIRVKAVLALDGSSSQVSSCSFRNARRSLRRSLSSGRRRVRSRPSGQTGERSPPTHRGGMIANRHQPAAASRPFRPDHPRCAQAKPHRSRPSGSSPQGVCAAPGGRRPECRVRACRRPSPDEPRVRPGVGPRARQCQPLHRFRGADHDRPLRHEGEPAASPPNLRPARARRGNPRPPNKREQGPVDRRDSGQASQRHGAWSGSPTVSGSSRARIPGLPGRARRPKHWGIDVRSAPACHRHPVSDQGHAATQRDAPSHPVLSRPRAGSAGR